MRYRRARWRCRCICCTRSGSSWRASCSRTRSRRAPKRKQNTPSPRPGPDLAATFFGHPRGLATLFLTEMWERFTYYGMRAVLILFLVASVASGGLGLDDKTAAAIYGLYTASVYLAGLPGGWVADRLIGAQRAVMLGGALITAGNLLLAISTSATGFYIG